PAAPGSRAGHPADAPEVAPRRTRAAARIVAHVALADALRQRARIGARRLQPRPELVLAQVIVARVSRQLLLRARPQQPARLALAGERPIQPAERLDADEVAQDEHVERELQPLR